MVDNAKFGHGGVTYPLTPATTNSLLQDADPALYYAIDFFQSVINTYLSERLLAEAIKAPAITVLAAAVAAVVPLDPTPYMQEQQFRYPLLAVYRKNEKFVRMSASTMSDDAEWGVDYILPPMTGGQMERIYPILRSVGEILSDRIENMMDPYYANGAAVWSLAGIAEIELREASYGAFAGTGNLVFPAWRGKLFVKELTTPAVELSALGALTGIDNQEFVEGTLVADGTTEIDLVDTKTDFP